MGGRVRGLGGGIRNGSIRDCYLQLGASGSSSGALGMWGGGRRATGDRGWNGGPEEVHVSHTPGFALPCPSQTYSTPAAPKNTGWTVPRPFGKIKCRKWEGVRAGRRGEVGGGAGVWEVRCEEDRGRERGLTSPPLTPPTALQSGGRWVEEAAGPQKVGRTRDGAFAPRPSGPVSGSYYAHPSSSTRRVIRLCQATGRMRTNRATKGASNMFLLWELLSQLPGKI